MKKLLLILSALCLLSAEATTLRTVIKTCGNCSNKVEVVKIEKHSPFTGMDMDMRAAPPNQNDYRYQIEACSNCCYCARDISLPLKTDGAKAVLKTNRFNTKNIARCYARAAALAAHENQGRRMVIALYSRAAWGAEDAKDEKEFRIYLEKCIYHLTINGTDRLPLHEMLMLCDYYRRLGMFDKAEEVALKILSKKKIGQLIKDNAESELSLCDKKDTRRARMIISEPSRLKEAK